METKSVGCPKPGSDSHQVPANEAGQLCCGNCGGSNIIMIGTSSVTAHVRGWCEDHDYCKDCHHITWPGHFTGEYKEGERVVNKWHTREATEEQIKRYEH